MDREDLNFDFEKEITEDFTEILNSINEDAKMLENDFKKSEDLFIEEEDDFLDLVKKDDSFIKEDNDDFLDLVKKRDYNGLDDGIIATKKNSSPKRKLKKWAYLVILILLLGIGFGTYIIINNRNIARQKEEEKRLVENIKKHYHQYVKVSTDTNLYQKKDNEYKKIGMVYKDANLVLEDMDIDINTIYFKIKDMDYYIGYLDVDKSSEVTTDNRYQKYLPFNTNIVTKDSFTMYLDDTKYMMLNEGKEFPVIINDYDGKYYVEYNNMLVNIKKDDVEKTVNADNTKKSNQSYITTLCYHRIYDTNDKCTDSGICLNKKGFDEQMHYLSDNNYLTLTLNELYLYLTGKIKVEKATVITFDDGYLYKAADEVLHKYNLNGTMFVITGDFADFTPLKELTNIDLQSHTNNLHRNYVCAGGTQGGAILCTSEAKIKEDLELSIKKLGTEPIGLAYPFYDYNDHAIKAVKAAGFKMAFVGRAGQMGKAKPNQTNLYKIPRMTVYDTKSMSFNEWKGYL